MLIYTIYKSPHKYGREMKIRIVILNCKTVSVLGIFCKRIYAVAHLRRLIPFFCITHCIYCRRVAREICVWWTIIIPRELASHRAAAPLPCTKEFSFNAPS